MRDKTSIIKLLIMTGFLAMIVAGISRTASAEEAAITVSPSIIDEKARPRDIIERDIKLVNSSDVKVELYAVVNDMKSEGGLQDPSDPIYLDKASSLARWIEINRGVIELPPGGEATLPLKVKVNLSAQPGSYYAQIAFASGSNRNEAEGKAASTNPSKITLNIEVQDNVVERAEIEQFAIRRAVNMDKKADFLLKLKNIGNREIAPSGSIVIHNNRGQEVGLLEVNKGGQKIAPDESSEFNQEWQAGNRIGRFKATLALDYGDKESRNLQDTVFFWIFPIWFLALSAALVVILVVSLAILSSRMKRHEKNYLTDEDRARKLVINLKNKNKTD